VIREMNSQAAHLLVGHHHFAAVHTHTDGDTDPGEGFE
jgi:hypothetical protein